MVEKVDRFLLIPEQFVLNNANLNSQKHGNKDLKKIRNVFEHRTPLSEFSDMQVLVRKIHFQGFNPFTPTQTSGCCCCCCCCCCGGNGGCSSK